MSVNPAVVQWIRQLADDDQAVAFYAYQCLQDEVLQTSRAGQDAAQAGLAEALGKELVAEAGSGGERGAGSFRDNAFLAAAATTRPTPKHPARVRGKLARLLGYIPHAAAVPYLAKALNDLEAREMARQSLECNGSDAATDALISALDSAGPEFGCGVVSSLAKRRGTKVAAALRRATQDIQEDVRIAALYALAEQPDPEHDAIFERAAKASTAAERRAAHIARARFAAALRSSGNRSAADRVSKAILASDAPEPQKKASRLALA